MGNLFLRDKKMKSVFQLLGEHENDISYSVAWGLSQCSAFLEMFLSKIINWSGNVEDVEIRLQQYGQGNRGKGYTDIEIQLQGRFHLIIEAKRGWNLPTVRQLQKYASRESFTSSQCPIKRILVLSECSKEYAEPRIPKMVDGINVGILTWKDIYYFSKIAYTNSTHAEKRLLLDLNTYLGGLMTMQKVDSNLVYVVSLGQGCPDNWNISWRDIVRVKNRYFHPVGNNWVKEPPNYIAFRYDGRLQSIHHIENYEIFTKPNLIFSEAPDINWQPSFLYHLGPAIIPNKVVKTGGIYRNARAWCMLDTLFTCSTISEARDLTNARLRN